MSRTPFILVVMIVLVLGAGVVVGRLWANLPVITHHDEEKPKDWPAQILKLTPDQQTRMDAIWTETHQKMDETFEERRALDRERDQAIAALLSPEQYVFYEEIQKAYKDERTGLDKVRQKLIADAEQRSKGLLDADQLKRWDGMPHKPHGLHGPTTGPGFGFDGPPPHGSTTRPFHPDN
jgi:hypothetical protein